MKKRFFAMMLCIVAVMTLFVFPMTVSAEEVSAETLETVETETPVAEEPVVEEETAPEIETPVPEAPEASGDGENAYHTFFTRIREFITTYSGETLSVLGSVILLILNLILKHAGYKSSKDTKKALEAIKGEVDETLGGQNSVVDVVNNMIDGYNSLSEKYDAMKESYDLYGQTEDERNRVVGAVLATNTAIIEILTTVYVNSKNLPQGVKDIVNLKYANCLKTLDDDKQLKAIVEAVRNNIGATGATAETTETKTEDAEVTHDQQNEG